MGRLGRSAATHVRVVVLAWIAVALVFGAFAPRVETALSGAGWQANGSQSIAARTLIQQQFAGNSSSALMVVVHSPTLTASDAQFAGTLRRAEQLLRADPAITSVTPPSPGAPLSRDGHTATVMAGAARNPTDMVAAADRLKGKLNDLGNGAVRVNTTGASAMWSDFNTANRTAMMKSELFSWPVTLAILVVAFGSLVAAGLPLMLTITGLVASAGVLFLGSQIADISIWAMNFALMFALALGIDYALFIVARYRAALRLAAVASRGRGGDDGHRRQGRALLRPDCADLTVGGDARPQPRVPVDGARHHGVGDLRAGAALTLLPAVLAWLGHRVDRLSLSWVHSGEHRSPRFALWAERLWRRPYAFGAAALADSARAGDAHRRTSHRHALHQGRPHRRHIARWLQPGAGRVRRRCAGRDADRHSRPRGPPRCPTAVKADPGVAAVMPTNVIAPESSR